MELEHSVGRALQRVRILRNDARPIGKLPPEILIPIFNLVATPSEEVDPTSAFENLTSLIRVCRYWRAILFNHCGVWSNVHLKGQDPDFLAWQMEFSKSAPLDVTAHLHQRVSGYRSLHNFQASVDSIRGCRRRVRSLSVHIPRDDFFQDAFDFELSNLEELAWEEMDLDPPAPLIGNPVWNTERCPKLRSLSLKGTLDWPAGFVTGLTRFKFEGPMTLFVTNISLFLEANTTLESLELVNLHVPSGTPQQARRIGLHNLTTLSLSNVEYGHVFTCMSLPALESLHIGTFDQPALWSWTVWHNLSLPSGITSLNVKYLGWEDGLDRVRITGFDDARTHSFDFTEHSVGARFNHMISAFSPAAIHSVTSISFDEEGTNDPLYQLSSSKLEIILSRLHNLTRMDLCWGHLTHQMIKHLERKCPMLKVLRVKTTRMSCSATFDLVLRMAKIRAGARQRLDSIECAVPKDEDHSVKTGELWDNLARTAGLDRYLSDG